MLPKQKKSPFFLLIDCWFYWLMNTITLFFIPLTQFSDWCKCRRIQDGQNPFQRRKKKKSPRPYWNEVSWITKYPSGRENSVRVKKKKKNQTKIKSALILKLSVAFKGDEAKIPLKRKWMYQVGNWMISRAPPPPGVGWGPVTRWSKRSSVLITWPLTFTHFLSLKFFTDFDGFKTNAQ